MDKLAIGSNESASLSRPAWNQFSGWLAYRHLHRQGRSITRRRGRRQRTNVQDGRIKNFFYIK